jgi:beta-fructofuranosidase
MDDGIARDIEATRRYREKLLSDPHRPGYHFAVPDGFGMPGDPNGAFFADGRYHLMYLYDRAGERHWHDSAFCWGHLSSHDLVHWRNHPDALAPCGGDGGIFSGGAFVDEDGTAYLSYWALPRNDETVEGSGIGIARSVDRDYDRWERIALIQGTDWGILETVDGRGEPLHLCCADPSNIWKQGGIYHLQAGNLPVLDKYGRGDGGAPGYQGDWTDLFLSEDLRAWRYAGRFYERRTDDAWTDRTEDDMCPVFLPLPGGPDGGAPTGKHLQLFIAHNRGCQYYVGTYDPAVDRFLPESHSRMSWKDNTFFAPEALTDERGRLIMWAWLLDDPDEGSEAARLRDGWSGVFGLPRSLWLEDGVLRMAPVRELESLRLGDHAWEPGPLRDGETRALPDTDGLSCEILLDIAPGSARRVGLAVRAALDGSEETRILVDRDTGELVFDATRSGVDGRRIREAAPFALSDGEPLQLRVFVDRSVVEVYANHRQAIARRVYPGGTASTGIRLFSEGGTAEFRCVRAWGMMPSNPY